MVWQLPGVLIGDGARLPYPQSPIEDVCFLAADSGESYAMTFQKYTKQAFGHPDTETSIVHDILLMETGGTQQPANPNRALPRWSTSRLCCSRLSLAYHTPAHHSNVQAP